MRLFKGKNLKLILVGHTHSNAEGRIGNAWVIETASLVNSKGYSVFFIRGEEPAFYLWKEVGKTPFVGLYELGRRRPSEFVFRPMLEELSPIMDTTEIDDS